MNSRIDHVVIGATNLIAGTNYLETKLKTKLSPGGEHKVMSTHNKLLKLQSNMYLELIANNPHANTPFRPRWFSLDESNIKEKIKNTPRALCWVLEVNNLEDTVKQCGYNPGEILQLSRDDLKWKVTIPSDGKLIDNGVLPIIIEWPNNQHPSNKLNNSNISINKLNLFHPEPNKIQKIISNLIDLDLINISEGLPKMELVLKTRIGKVVID